MLKIKKYKKNFIFKKKIKKKIKKKKKNFFKKKKKNKKINN